MITLKESEKRAETISGISKKRADDIELFAHEIKQIAIKHKHKGDIGDARCKRLGSEALLKRAIFEFGFKEIVFKLWPTLMSEKSENHEGAYQRYLEILSLLGLI
jgi:hypothetical protein